MEMPGIEPGTFHMQSERSTAELQPHAVRSEQLCSQIIIEHKLMSVMLVRVYVVKADIVSIWVYDY